MCFGAKSDTPIAEKLRDDIQRALGATLPAAAPEPFRVDGAE